MQRTTLWMAAPVAGVIALANPATAAGAFDGTYAGVPRMTAYDNTGRCDALRRENTRIVVKDSVIDYVWYVPLETTVGADGSFSAVGEWRSRPVRLMLLKGRVSGGNLEADVGDIVCGAHLSLKKV